MPWQCMLALSMWILISLWTLYISRLLIDSPQPHLHPQQTNKLVRSGLCYKHVTILNDNSSIVNRWSFKVIDDARVLIYNRHMFIIQALVYMKIYPLFCDLTLSTHPLYKYNSFVPNATNLVPKNNGPVSELVQCLKRDRLLTPDVNKTWHH